MAGALDLGSSGETRGGSNPPPGTTESKHMAYVKAAIKNAMRERVSALDGIYSCWIERCNRTKDGKYDLDLRLSNEGISFALLEEISRIFRTKAINVDGGYEDSGCPTCGGYSYVEVNLTGATFSI